MREAAGVYLDGSQLTFRGETVAVRGVVADALEHLIAAVNSPGMPRLISLGPYDLDVTNRRLSGGTSAVHFTGNEALIVAALMSRAGLVIAHERMQMLVYGNEGPGRRVLDVMVCDIRKKLREAGVALKIETARGYGRRMWLVG